MKKHNFNQHEFELAAQSHTIDVLDKGANPLKRQPLQKYKSRFGQEYQKS